MRCLRCGRTLKREPVDGYGPRCLIVVTGAKPKRIATPRRRHAGPDDKQAELFHPVFAVSR